MSFYQRSVLDGLNASGKCIQKKNFGVKAEQTWMSCRQYSPPPPRWTSVKAAYLCLIFLFISSYVTPPPRNWWMSMWSTRSLCVGRGGPPAALRGLPVSVDSSAASSVWGTSAWLSPLSQPPCRRRRRRQPPRSQKPPPGSQKEGVSP